LKKPSPVFIPEQKVTSSYLYQSDFYEIKDWELDFRTALEVGKGYNDCFCMVVVRKGSFLFGMGKESYDMHTGHIVIDKPDYEYSLRPASGVVTIFNFTVPFYEQFLEDYNLKSSFFFSNKNILSLLLNATAQTDYQHFQILKNIGHVDKLEMDARVLDLVKQVTELITDKSLDFELSASLKRNHLSTIEQAKEYLNENFTSDISLQQLASHCCVSLFHFSRIFKKFTNYSPHRYLLDIRLKHAELLLKNSARPVADIGFSSGFNSTEHFAAAFKQKYKLSPSAYRTA
jgi:AraC family transcriptional regulator